MVAVRFLTKMRIRILEFVQWCPAHIAYFHTTGARHFVASVRLDKVFLALWACSYLCLSESFFNFKTALVLAILLRNFLASQGNMRCSTAFTTRDKLTMLHWALENILHLGHFCLVTAFWTHGQVSSQTSLLDMSIGLHFRIFLPRFG